MDLATDLMTLVRSHSGSHSVIVLLPSILFPASLGEYFGLELTPVT